jgi:hypothetical protein
VHLAPSPSLTRALLVFGVALAFLIAAVPVRADPIDEQILLETAEIRELQPIQPVPLEVVDPVQLRGELLQSYENQEAVIQLEASRKLLVMLGLLSPDADLHGMLVDLYAENIAGYYSRADKRMHVVSTRDAFGAEEKVTLAHEFTHALQDQYFDLAKVQAGVEENGDRSLAVQALIEGDATLTMVLYAQTFLTTQELFDLQTGGSTGTLETAPPVIRDEISFPYNEGVLFALQLYQGGGFEAVNQAFRDPPRSTEQILHPEKYLEREEPTEIRLPDLAAALGSDWKQLRSDVLGELDFRILLQQFSTLERAARGAEGWAGDRFALLESPNGTNALVIDSLWDSNDEAGEFFNHYVETVNRRYGRRASRTQDAPSSITWSTPNGALTIQNWGARVAIIMAPDARVLQALTAALTGAPVPVPMPASVPAQLPR